MNRKEYIEQIKSALVTEYGIEMSEGADLETIFEKAWINDYVTGNGSGSYYFSRQEAKEAIDGAEDVIRDLVAEYGISADEVARRFLDEDWEYWDVSIRCYLLGEAIAEIEEKLNA